MSEREIRNSVGVDSYIGQPHVIFDLKHQRLARQLDPNHFTTARILGKTSDVARSVAVFTADHPVASSLVGVTVASLLVGGASRIRQAQGESA